MPGVDLGCLIRLDTACFFLFSDFPEPHDDWTSFEIVPISDWLHMQQDDYTIHMHLVKLSSRWSVTYTLFKLKKELCKSGATVSPLVLCLSH